MRWAILVCTVVLIAAGTPFIGPAADEFVLWQLRVPRVLMAVLVGCVLGVAGAVYQCLFENALATPSTVGTTGGAALGAMVASLVYPLDSVVGMPIIVVAAFLGAALVTALIATIAARPRAQIADVLLAGIAISLGASAITMGLKASADMAATMRVVRWSMGNLSQVGYERVVIMAPIAAISVVAMLRLARPLEALALGYERAATVGVRIHRLRAVGLGSGSLGLGACVALCGPIAFVGLIVPHIARGLVGDARHRLLPASALVGAAFLTAADTLGRSLLEFREIPVGVITAATGAPLLVFIIWRQASRR